MEKTNKNNNMVTKWIKKTSLAVLLGGAMLSMPLSLISSPANADGIVALKSSTKTRSIQVPVAKPTTFRTDAVFNEIVVGDPDIAIVTPLTDQSFYVVGSKKGTTGIALFNAERELIGSLDIEIGADTVKLNSTLKQALKGTKIKAKTQNGNLVLTGKAKTAAAAETARKIAAKYDDQAVDSLQVQASTQVQLEVRFIEAQRSKTKELGIQLGGSKGRFGFNSGLTSVGTGTPFGNIITSMIAGGASVDIIIDALEQKGVARRLAEPNLVALSGDKASFLAGGEFPIPVAREEDGITIEYKKFGVSLDFTPTVLDNGLINLQIEPEVSSLDNTNSYDIGDLTIPGFSVRRANTTVELRDGQAFVLAGMLQSTGSYDVRKFPWLGDLPILGPLFRSSSYRKNETDLVIIVTPRVVKPIAPGTNIATPLDSHAAPNDVDLFLLGKAEVSRANLRNLADAGEGILPAGHILDF